MGYYYRESGYGGCDYLVVTKKGMEECQKVKITIEIEE